MARRRSYYEFYHYEPARPIEVEGGIKARSRRGKFVKSWWASRWIEALVQFMDAGRLQRGRGYARRGQVVSLEEQPGRVEARVQGTRRTPYEVTLQVTPLSEKDWEQVIDQLATQALFTARLIAGEMPEDIETAFSAVGVSLFPSRGSDLETNCSCPDWANPCKHIAAVHYILGERFDEDPFMIFRLRGRTQEQILAALRQRRSGELMLEEETEVVEEEVSPLDESLQTFWVLGEPLEDFSVTIQPPSISMPLLKRLDEPAFLAGASLKQLLAPTYEAISKAALAAGFEAESE